MTLSQPITHRMLNGKLHRVVVTKTDIDYNGSIVIDAALLEAAQILEYEEVHVWNITNGERFTTYAMNGERNSGMVCVNGAAVFKASRGDLLIVAAFVSLSPNYFYPSKPHIVIVSEQNKHFYIQGNENESNK